MRMSISCSQLATKIRTRVVNMAVLWTKTHLMKTLISYSLRGNAVLALPACQAMKIIKRQVEEIWRISNSIIKEVSKKGRGLISATEAVEALPAIAICDRTRKTTTSKTLARYLMAFAHSIWIAIKRILVLFMMEFKQLECFVIKITKTRMKTTRIRYSISIHPCYFKKMLKCITIVIPDNRHNKQQPTMIKLSILSLLLSHRSLFNTATT